MEKVNYVYLRIMASETWRRDLAFTCERSRGISANSKINLDLYGLEEEEKSSSS